MRSLLIVSLFCLTIVEAFAQSATYTKSVVTPSSWATNPVIATSTQQNGIAVYDNYVYMTYYNTDRNLCVARNSNYGDGSWVEVVLPHTYELRNGVWDNHNTPNIAISPNDKRIHLSFDLHARNLRYIISTENAAIASDANFVASLFSSTRDYLQSSERALTLVTYPRFFVGANDKLFIMFRVGGSGSGDTFLGEYKDDGFWFSPAKIINGKTESYEGSPDRCAYFNNVHVKDGRIILTWVWRETPDGATNHDLMFAYSDDDGATWFNSSGAALPFPMTLNSPGLTVATIPTNSGLANHNGCAIDGHGNVHTVLRVNGVYQHHYGIKNGNSYDWSTGTIASFTGDRPKIYADQTTNDLYFLARQGNGLKMYATSENNETWNQWSQISMLSDLVMTSTNSVMNAAGDMLTSMVVSTDNRLQIIKWSLTTTSPDIQPKIVVPVTIDPIQYSWDIDGDLEGWSGNNVDNVTAQNGSIRIISSGQQYPSISVDNLSADVSHFPNALIRMKVYSDIGAVNTGGGTTGTSARIVPNSDPGDRFASFNHTSGDNEFKTYIVPLAPHAKYSGMLNGMMIQALRNQITTTDTMEISDFRLISVPNTWNGATSSVWEVASNWSLNKVPSGEIVTVPLVTNQPIISDSVAAVADLNLSDGVILTVTGNATLTIFRNLNVTGSGHVVVASGSSLNTYGEVEGTVHIIERSTTYGSNTGQYSAVGSPVSGATTSLLGSLVYSYDESIAYDANRFIELTSPETMASGDAYFSAYTGEVTFSGAPHSGIVSVPLQYNAADGSNAGFNLVSNPYPSAIDFEHLVTTNEDISGTIYLWDDGGSNTGQRDNADYITVNIVGEVATASNGSGRSADWNGSIGSAQGFFVKANDVSAELNFDNEMKVTGNNESANYFRKGLIDNGIQTLKISLTNQQGAINESLLGFLDNATMGYDRLYDAYKMDGANGVKIYTVLEGKPMSIQGLPIVNEMTIPLGIATEEAGEFTINLQSIKNWSEGKNIYLEDTKLNKIIDLRDALSYTFSSRETTGEERFNLILSTEVITAKVLGATDQLKSDLLMSYTRSGMTITSHELIDQQMLISILDLSGALLFSSELNGLTEQTVIDFSFDAHKVYLIRVNTQKHSLASKILFD